MLTYEYVCGSCAFVFSARQSIHDSPLVECPGCGRDSLRRQFFAVDVISRDEPKTVAQQADRNEKSMGRHELEDKRREAGGGTPRTKPERPWWRKTDKVDTELAKLAPNVVIEKGKVVKSEPLGQKAMDYIMTGSKP